ncbi:MAG: substrate-binding domain-containing protein, partial [Chloroflexota bacterium]
MLSVQQQGKINTGEAAPGGGAVEARRFPSRVGDAAQPCVEDQQVDAVDERKPDEDDNGESSLRLAQQIPVASLSPSAWPSRARGPASLIRLKLFKSPGRRRSLLRGDLRVCEGIGVVEREVPRAAAMAVAPRLFASEPDGVFCCNDRLAQGLLLAAARHGRALPHIVGFDDAPIAAQLNLST